MNLINAQIIIGAAILTSCNWKTSPSINSSKINRQELSIKQKKSMICVNGSPAFVIFNKASESLIYCNNGNWDYVNPPENQKELTQSNPKTNPTLEAAPKTRRPDAHLAFPHEQSSKDVLDRVVADESEVVENRQSNSNEMSTELPPHSKRTITTNMSERPDERENEIPLARPKAGIFHCRSSSEATPSPSSRSYRCQRAH